MNIRQQTKLVCTCNCQLNELYGAWAKRHGMSYNTMMILYALHQYGAGSQKEIAEAWMIPKQTVNTVVKDLERQGYVRFTAGRDQKEKRIGFTEAGRQFAEARLRDLYDLEDRAMEAIGPALRQALVASNRAYTAAFAREVRHEA